MSYQSEAALEQQFIEQLNKQGYNPVSIPDYDALLENFKIQFAAFNAAKLDHPLTDKEWERVFNIMILSILVYTFFSRMFDLMLPPVAKHSIVVA